MSHRTRVVESSPMMLGPGMTYGYTDDTNLVDGGRDYIFCKPLVPISPIPGGNQIIPAPQSNTLFLRDPLGFLKCRISVKRSPGESTLNKLEIEILILYRYRADLPSIFVISLKS